MGRFSTKNIKELTVTNIYEIVNDYSLFKYYISGFERVGKVFCSELRDDRRPSCGIYSIEGTNKLRYKDFANDLNINIFEYIQLKFKCSFVESLNIINNDFNLKLGNNQNKAITTTLGYFGIIDRSIEKYELKTAKIAFKSRNFTISDIEYWNQYYININNESDIKSISHYWINDNLFNCEKELAFVYIYENSYKLYFPNRTVNRFYTNTRESGYYKINDGIWVITSSKKDAMVYRNLGYNSIYSQAETIMIKEELLLDKKCIVNLDNDDTGRKYTEKYIKKYNFNYFYTPEKDVSDTIRVLGLKKTKNYIKKEISKYE